MAAGELCCASLTRMRARLGWWALAVAAPWVVSCGGAPCACPDETALRERIQHAVRAELRSNPAVAAMRGEPEPEPEGALPDEEVERVRVDPAGGPRRGAREPLVTLVAFSEFQCPFCARVEPTLARLLETYPNEVRIVWRNYPLPFHQDAQPAAEAAMEAFEQGGDALFWRYHAALFENQQALSRADLLRYGVEVGMNVVELARALDTGAHRAAVQADEALGQRLGIRGTPNFLINGRPLRGAQPYEAFDEVVREELALARRELARGVPRGELYARRMREAREAPPLPPRPAPTAAPPPADTVYAIPVPARAPSRGPANAPVTIQIFSDFQCPFCSRVRPTLDRLLAERSDVRLVWRDYPLPFHENAMPAAEAAREVFVQRGNDAFWRFHDLVFENQRQLDTDSLVRLAAQVQGVDATRVRRALEQGTHRAAVRADMRAMDEVRSGVGTPSFLVNGRLVQGAQPIDVFRTAVDRAVREGRP